jgi:hypothetical protein
METEFRAVVADTANGVADQRVVVQDGAGGNFAGDHGQAGGHQGLAGNTALGVYLHDFIENRIGNLVGNLVRMAFGDGLRGKQVIS